MASLLATTAVRFCSRKAAASSCQLQHQVRSSVVAVHNNLRYKSTAAAVASSSDVASPWAQYEMAPTDPIIGLNELYAKDDFPKKVIVGVGAYRCDEGEPWVLPCVREADKRLADKHLDMEYSGIAGDPKFVELAIKFAYGKNCKAIAEDRVHGVQSLSGTGGLAVFGALIHKHGARHIYVPDPTWGNHIPIFHNQGLEVRKYRYYDTPTSSLNFDGLMEDFKSIPEGSWVLLHACAHNPTGMDPDMEQWKLISDLMKERNLLPFFDFAYQGFASGCADKDAAAFRMFVDEGHFMACVQSFSKNFGLYGHRVGALSVVGATPDEAKRVVSQMKMIIRPMYSNPPRHGARLVNEVLMDENLTDAWEQQCHHMADRINSMRIVLRSRLENSGSHRTWKHITDQIGMFAYSGMTKQEVMEMREKHHVYCTLDGRISMAGVTSSNVDYIAQAIHDVTKGHHA